MYRYRKISTDIYQAYRIGLHLYGYYLKKFFTIIFITYTANYVYYLYWNANIVSEMATF